MTKCIVTPLQPPFNQDVTLIDMAGDGDKTLAVSREDAAKIFALLGGFPIKRTIILSPVPGDELKIEVSALQ